MAMAYYNRLAGGVAPISDLRAFLTDLNLCRLHVAVQWLGWATDWRPPDEQAQDWLRNATEVAGELGW
jgi:hypothetical protein